MKLSKIDSIKGLLIAMTVIGLWGSSLFVLLSLEISKIYIIWIVPLVIWQTFLYTGLFITAHDAMHGTVFPANRKLNNFVGVLCVRLYALFSYKKLRAEHREHHRHPASADDPDFHDGEHRGLFRWYLHFMKNYLTWKQLAGMAIAYNVLMYIFNVEAINLVAFWAVPSLLSTWQLFYFGTYLPHREAEPAFGDHHNARSNEFSLFWSFITCYHFGYHWEHHAYPYIPWWKLPEARRKSPSKTGA